VSRSATARRSVSRSATARRHPAVEQGSKADPRRRMIFYQYHADRARRTLKGIDRRSTRGRWAGGRQTEPVPPAHRRQQKRQL
jgi:hypothetical protein